nr:GNAT family N-acetyltransferase [Phycisphaerae bacterium]NIP55534.1 GNAT family N-acetyltransferase [Phycisphaerae bacterium]NIW45685.1 GNAT family N-acetyltransferase [Gammaproteobacteria bacterium]NIX31757.1 GNAT family N-acetyltransferase [Phycisphaerae bacterium]
FGLFNFYVHKNYRRKGIASDMIKIMEDWASDQGARLSYLQVDSDNPNAIQLYQKLGYQTIYEYWYLMDSS